MHFICNCTFQLPLLNIAVEQHRNCTCLNIKGALFSKPATREDQGTIILHIDKNHIRATSIMTEALSRPARVAVKFQT